MIDRADEIYQAAMRGAEPGTLPRRLTDSGAGRVQPDYVPRPPESVECIYRFLWWGAQRDLIRAMRRYRAHLDGFTVAGGVTIPRKGWGALWREAKANAWADAVRKHARQCLLLGIEPQIPDHADTKEAACL